MPPPLSYPTLKLVLEYLEVKKRHHITSRNSALQKIDKTIPLHVRHFEIWESRVSLDDLSYNGPYKLLDIDWEANKELYKLLKTCEAKEELVKKYLEGRPDIHVDRVVFNNVKVYEKVPLKLNLITNKLVTMCCSDFPNFLSMIDSRSFPLKKLELIQEEPIDADHPVIHTAKDVIFRFNGQDELIKGIEKLQREKLTLQNISFFNVDVEKIIKDWINNGRNVGTEYLLGFSNPWIQLTLTCLKMVFDEFQNDLEGINVQFLSNEPRFSIPMSPTSKIIIYGTRIQSEDGTVYQLVLKVVSTD